jgi:DNA topoisomerase-2
MSENQNQEEKQLSIEEKYTQLSDIDHVLLKPGVYIGNIYSEVIEYNLFQPSDNRIIRMPKVGYNAGLLKLFDEIITNPIDERRRKSRLFNISRISVRVMRSGEIEISDDGGIHVVVHKVTNMWLPTMIFGHLKTSSNYTEERQGAGTNGLGAKLSNIFSTWFTVTTSDGKNQIVTSWQNNMKEHTEEAVEKAATHGTRVNFQIDLKRFGITELDMATIRIMQKRCIDACAANPGLIISFETDAGEGKLNQEFKFSSFREFVMLHLNEEQQRQCLDWTGMSQDGLVLLPNIGYDFGFVNGAVCSAGSHIKKAQKKIIEKFLEIFKKRDMELITETDVKNAISLFVTVSVKNPDYDAQTKTNLTNPIPSDILSLSKQFLETLETSIIVEHMVEVYQMKYAKEQKKLLSKLNADIKKTKSKKFTPCSNRGDKQQNKLFLYEGTSAANGHAMYADPQYMASYELRGKVKNTLNLSKSDIVDNQELRELISILNLQFNDAQNNIKNCAFGMIVFATDMDHDGAHICGLLITFFAKHFPELFLAKKIYRLISPIIIADRGGVEKYFYTMEEFEKVRATLNGWEISYKKGLGSLQDQHYDEMLNNPRLVRFVLKDKNYLKTVETWFDKSTSLRKELLLEQGDGGVEGAEEVEYV